MLINQREGKLSDIIHAGDSIDFVPAVPGIGAKACLGDIDGAADCVDITLNGIHVPLKTPLKSGDVIHMILPKKAEVKKVPDEAETGEAETENGGETEEAGTEGKDSVGAKDEIEEAAPDAETGGGESASMVLLPDGADTMQPEQAAGNKKTAEVTLPKGSVAAKTSEESGAAPSLEQRNIEERHSGSALERLGRFGTKITPMMGEEKELNLPESIKENSQESHGQGEISIEDSVSADSLRADESQEADEAEEELAGSEEEAPVILKSTVVFRLNGSPIELPAKEDGRPYYLMDMIQYSGIDLERPKGVVKLTVNNAPGMFQQVLREGDIVCIEEEHR